VKKYPVFIKYSPAEGSVVDVTEFCILLFTNVLKEGSFLRKSVKFDLSSNQRKFEPICSDNKFEQCPVGLSAPPV